jgi:quercetin dioxygenase-like cupin family protein
MPIEIQRFGVGHRRPDGPPGTTGVTGQVIHSDGRGLIAELAFGRGARMEPHSSPNTTWMLIIEGGGWVAVQGERTRVAVGEAILWPADTPHAAWTEHSEMRAIIVEFRGADDHDLSEIVEGRFHVLLPDGARPVQRGEGGLADRPAGQGRPDPEAGEPA